MTRHKRKSHACEESGLHNAGNARKEGKPKLEDSDVPPKKALK